MPYIQIALKYFSYISNYKNITKVIKYFRYKKG